MRTSAAKLGSWVGVVASVVMTVATVVTITLTVWNVHTKDRIDETVLGLNVRAQDLEEAKEKIVRYGFVGTLIPKLKSADEQDRTLNLALIRLALTPEEAELLFAGLAHSGDQSLHAAGQTGIANLENEASLKVTGSIEKPTPDQNVGKTIQCSGVVTGLQPGLSLWLAVEKGASVYPKEGRPVPGPDNKWTASIFEDGKLTTGPPDSNKFSIALFVADQEANKRIQTWLDDGNRTRSYDDMKDLRGARRIARIDGLSVVR
jgi:hypothetical protein